jgi:esterase/lipase superfamily enzyme
MHAITYTLVSGFLGVALLMTGCSTARLMMPTPNVYLDAGRDYYANLAPELQDTEVSLFYITDRAPEQDEGGRLRYGYQRSTSLAFGTAIVDLGVDITWDELLEASRMQRRLKPVKLKLRDVKEVIRGPDTPLPFKEVEGQLVEEPGSVAKRKKGYEAFRPAIVRQLQLTPRKEVFIYVHGYHNSFNDAAFAMAELWHFLGRTGVPIIYTWPAGYPGMFGYTYDRESSEFTVYHLRRAIRFIASIPEVEKIHLIAHSRGTDVTVAALRELTIGARAAGLNPREAYKIDNLVLAAPDMDVEVAVQRISGDHLSLSVKRLTFYTSPADKAIGIAAKLFASPRGRVGTFGMDDASEHDKSAFEYGARNMAFINFSGAKDASESKRNRYGHSYFRDAPTVSSDLVLLLRDDLDPGGPGRPLEPIGPKFWQIPPGYPNSQPAQ